MVRIVPPVEWGRCATQSWFSVADAGRPPREVTVERDESITVCCAPYTVRLIPPSQAEVRHDDGRCASFPFAALTNLNRISETKRQPLAEVALGEYPCEQP